MYHDREFNKNISCLEYIFNLYIATALNPFNKAYLSMVYVFFTEAADKLPISKFNAYISQFPMILQKEIRQFQRFEDSQASLLGKLLLVEGLRKIGLPANAIDKISLSTTQRPFIPEAEFDFNISHSINCSVCAFSSTSRVGIDMEKIRSIDINPYKNEFTLQEWEKILAHPNREEMFFTLWTKKEAVVKAVGHGLSLPLVDIDVSCDVVKINTTRWYLTKIPFNKNFCIHLATNAGFESRLHLQQFYF